MISCGTPNIAANRMLARNALLFLLYGFEVFVIV